MTIPCILIYGLDARLLETRRRVLRASGYLVWMATRFSEFRRIVSVHRVDLVVFCHSLSTADCVRASTSVQTGWPEAKHLYLAAGGVSCSSNHADEAMNALDGPETLLLALDKLAGCNANSRVSQFLKT